MKPPLRIPICEKAKKSVKILEVPCEMSFLQFYD